MAVGGIRGAARRHRLLEEALHACRRRARREELGDEHERLVERGVDAAHHEQEAEQRKEVAGAFEHERGTHQQRRGKPQTQHHLGTIDRDAAGELGADRAALGSIHAPVHPLEIALLLIGRAHLAHALKRLLHELRGLEPSHAGLSHERLKPGANAEEQEQRHRTRPHRGHREPPVEGEQARERDGHRGIGAVEFGQHVAVGMLGGLDVGHEGLGEVGKVAAAEERKREPAQPLGEGDPLPAALLVDDAVLVVVLEPLAHEEHDEIHGKHRHPAEDGHVKRVETESPPRSQRHRPAREPRHERAHDREDEPHAREHHEIGHGSPRSPQADVPYALVREGILLLHGHLGHLPGSIA